MIRILLACEGGSGLGHIDSLLMVARALGAGFSFDGVHYDDDRLQHLAPVCEAAYRGPAFLPNARDRAAGARFENWSWANFLERCGIGLPETLEPSLIWWREALTTRQIDLLVADYAPVAMLAAKTLGIPVVLTGTAYSVPPNGLRSFPAYLDRDAETTADEAAMVRNVNALCGAFGMPAITSLPQMFDCAVKLPQGVDFLDPYEGLRTEPLLPRPFNVSSVMAGQGSEIFVYLSNAVADPDFMFEALGELGLPVRALVPWISADRAAMLRRAGVIVMEDLIPPDDIARRSRLMVLYGQPGTVALGLAAGLPQVACPQHFEQSIHAERAARAGGVRVLGREGLDRDGFVRVIRDAYADKRLQADAQKIAPRVRRQLQIDAPEMIRESLRPALVEIIKKKGLA